MPTRTDSFLELHPPVDHSWDGKVALGFSYPIHGWIQFAILCTTYVQDIVVNLSNVFDPFPDFARWLDDIAKGALPSEFIIDEEGQEKIFRALPLNEDEFIFQISAVQYGDARLQKEPVLLYTHVSRMQFLSEFLKRWDDFLQNQYDPIHWEEWGSDLRKLDVSKIRAFVANSPE